MAHGNRSSFRRNSGANRRRVSWSPGPSGTILGISTSSNNVFPTTSQATLDDLTLIRTRGELMVWLDVAGGAVNEGFAWAFGMCNITENAAGQGIAAMPNPIGDIAWDGWFVYETGTIVTRGTALEDASLLEMARIPIDSKAMRKTHQTDVIVGVLATTEQGDGATMTAQLRTRLLDKLA